MRVLRVTQFVMADRPPLTTITRDSDLRHSIEETIEILLRPSVIEQSGLMVHEVFEMPDGDFEDAVGEATRRLQARTEIESNMAILYFYNADAMQITMEGGHVINPRPAPLSAEDIETTLKQLATRFDYRHQSIITTSSDGIEITMKDGEVTRKATSPSNLN